MKRSKGGIKSEAIVLAGFSFGAKALAFLREILLASYFGAGTVLDAYYAGTAFSNFLLFFFSGGAFIPLIVSFYAESKGKDREGLNSFLLSLFLLSIVLSLATIFAGDLLTSGVRDSIRIETVAVLRITALTSVFYVLSSIIRAMLNSVENYRLSGLQDFVMILVIIGGIILATQGNALFVLAWSFLISALARVLIQLPSLFKNRKQFSWKLSWDWGVIWSYYKSFLPLMLVIMIPQIFVVFTKNMGAGLETGALSGLSFAERTSDLTRSIIAFSLGAVLVTPLAKAFVDGKKKRFGEILIKSLRYVFFVSIPIFMIFLLYGREVISFLYLRGSFSPEAADIAGRSLMIYSVVSLFSSPIYILSTAIYTMRSVSTFMKASLISVGSGIIFILLYIESLGIYAIAIGISIYSTLFFLSAAKMVLKRSERSLSAVLVEVGPLLILNIVSFGLGYLVSARTSVLVGAAVTVVSYILLSFLIKERTVSELKNDLLARF